MVGRRPLLAAALSENVSCGVGVWELSAFMGARKYRDVGQENVFP
jgi:hypothetical protein